MASPNEKLAESLKILHDLQDNNAVVAIRKSHINRIHRERLIKNGFLKTVTKGWYIASNPGERKGDSTSWFTSYWQFCSQFLNDKFGKDYCLSADQSLMMYAGNMSVPKELLIRAPKGINVPVILLHGTTLFSMKSSLPNIAEITVENGIRTLTLPFALIHCSLSMFKKNPDEIRIALTQIKDVSEILRPLLDGSHSAVAGRLAGAFRNNGQIEIAENIIRGMKSLGYDVRESDPFENKPPVILSLMEKSPYYNRIKLMWANMREPVLKIFPKSKGIQKDHKKYLKSIDEIYVTDAYHSLSIEKYIVSAELIEKVRKGKWNADSNEKDRKQKDAMAARGYWLANQSVKKSIVKILDGNNSGKISRQDHGIWYNGLFSPSVDAGLLKASDLAGYRTGQVYISQSMHVPLNKDAVRDAMQVLFELLEAEENPGVRAVLGHFIFVYIHPYMDGNGRMARFFMNVMLASGGYPWTVIPVEERKTYMGSLEKASVDGDIKPFVKFLSYLVSESMKGRPVAKLKS